MDRKHRTGWAIPQQVATAFSGSASSTEQCFIFFRANRGRWDLATPWGHLDNWDFRDMFVFEPKSCFP